jgi:hypothetical protein
MKLYFLLLVFFFSNKNLAQNLGGSATYSFLKLANSPQIAALGGTTVGLINNDVNLVLQNPAMLKPLMHNQLAVNFNFIYGGVKQLQTNYTKYKGKINTTFNAAVNYINYGKTTQTDATGNVLGNIIANDYNVQLTASRKYLEKWNYGTTIKFIGSNYGQFSSYGVALDAGINFSDTTNQIKAGLVFKNIGTQLKVYNTGSKEPLPLEMQLGISKKLNNAPIQFIFTITNAHQLDIRYADTAFENEINGSVQKGKFTIDKLFRHFIIGAQLYPTNNTELTIAYNFLRRKELALLNATNGFTGFSFGVGILLKAYQLRYARAYYQNSRAYHQVGLTIDFKALHY